MKKETFNEFNESMNEGLEIVKGNVKPSRTFSLSDLEDEITIPNDVVERMVMDGKSIVQSWREHMRLSQKDVSERMGITQAAYSQMENSPGKLRKDTLEKIAHVLKEVMVAHVSRYGNQWIRSGGMSWG